MSWLADFAFLAFFAKKALSIGLTDQCTLWYNILNGSNGLDGPDYSLPELGWLNYVWIK